MALWENVIGYGLHADRPTAGSPGALYFESDTRTAYRDSGTTWQLIYTEGTDTMRWRGDYDLGSSYQPGNVARYGGITYVALIDSIGVLPTAGTTLGRSGWTCTASDTNTGGGDVESKAIDANTSTRWATGADQTTGMWFEIDLGAPTIIVGITLDNSVDTGDFPAMFDVAVSMNNITWTGVATGTGTSPTTPITFGARLCRYVRVTLTTDVPGRWWSIDEVNGFAPVAWTPL